MNLKKNQGQSLIEIVIALAIIGIILIGLVRTVALSLKNMEFSTNKNLALNLAQAKMEEIRQGRDSQNWLKFWNEYLVLNGGNLATEYFKKDGTTTTQNAKERTFTRKGELTDKSASGDQNKVEVIIRVSWEEGVRTHYATISSYLTKWN